MKKFLTVLLVIAVMFTFSFSSAFATVDLSNVLTKADALNYAEKAYNDALDDLAKLVKKTLNKTYDVDGYVDVTNTKTISVSKASFLAAVEEDSAYIAAKKKIEDEYKDVVEAINTAASKAAFEGFEKNGTDDTVAYPAYTNTSDYVFDTRVIATTLALTTIDDKAAVKEFKTVKKAALDAVAAIVLDGVYSKEYKNAEKSNYDKASELVNLALEDLDAVGKTTAPTGVDTAADAVKDIKDIYTAPAGKAKAKGALYTGKKIDGTSVTKYGAGLNGIVKIADEENTATDLAYAQNKVLSSLLSDLAGQKDAVVDAYAALLRNERDADKPDTDKIAKWTKEMADTEAAYNDAVAAITYLVKYTEEASELGNFVAGVFTPAGWSIGTQVTAGTKDLATFKSITITTTTYAGTPALDVAECEDMAFEVAKAEKLAANDKIYINLDGSYAVQIDKALEKAIELIYTKNDTAANAYKTPTNTSELTARKKELIFANAGDNVNINGKKYETVNEWKAYADTAKATYEKDQYDEIRAIVEETKDAIKAAATIADAEAAFLAGYEKFDAIPTAQEHKNQFTLKSAFADKYDKYQEQFKAYVDAKNTSLTNLTVKDDYDYTVSKLKDYFAKELDGEFYNSVYTDADLDAVYAEALAVVDGLKTKAELKTQYEAVVTTINALPAAATVADKEAVKAARDAYDEYADYVDMIGAENVFTTKGAYVKVLAKLTSAEEAIKKAERKAIADAYKALPDVKKRTLADKAAVEAIREMLDAYVDSYVTKDASNTDTGNNDPKDSINDLYVEAMGGNAVKLFDFEGANGYEDVIAKEETKYVEDLIAKLAVAPVDATAVKAAREAYDAIPAYVFFDYGYDISDPAYDKLVALEKLIVMDEEAVKAYVQDLGIKARSTKTSKGVKVTIKADVQELLDNGYTVEYKFYRSTKSNKGFKAMVTKTTGTYTNTKGVKGTKYYYKAKLVVKNAAGEVVATTPLTQCLYATRTF